MSWIKTKIKIDVTRLVILMAVILCCLNNGQARSADSGLDAKTIIVKFKSESPLASTAAQLFANGEKFRSVVVDTNLDQLNEHYGLVNIIKLFPKNINLEEIKKKYPKRSKRIAVNAIRVEVNSIYKFVFDKPVPDVNQAVEQYSKDLHVEYAQPDYKGVGK